jgi:hypothetical protein
MKAVNLRSFRQKARHNKRKFRLFIARLKKHPVRGLDNIALAIDKEVWQETDCLTCGNCCKTMSPTYTHKDILRIAAYTGTTEKEFKEKWLEKDSSGDWLNKKLPCQFLDTKTNKCTIYSVRPADCSGFPHLTKKKMTEYIHVHKQNVEFCPATYKMVEKMMKQIEL